MGQRRFPDIAPCLRVALVLGWVCSGEVSAQPLLDCTHTSADFFAAVKAGDYAAAESAFDDRMRQALPPPALKTLFETQLANKLGALQAAGDGQEQVVGDMRVVVTPLGFEHGALRMSLTCGPDGRAGGLHVVAGATAASAAAYSPPAYADPKRYAEQAMQIGHAPPLPGTLSLPAGAGPFPAVVLVHGSGPHDRDESHGPNKTFADLASGLASRGIAVLRYDKRSFVYPRETAADAQLTVDVEVTDDAVAAVAALRGMQAIDPRRVFVLGHSLGAQLAPRIGLRAPAVAGLLLLAAPAAPIAETHLRQVRYLVGLSSLPEADRAKALRAAEDETTQLGHLRAGEPVTGPLPFHAPAAYLRSWLAVDAVADAQAAQRPLLILQGAGDYQVSPSIDFVRWRQAFGTSPNAKLIEYPGLSHLFMPAGDPPSPADYERASHVDGHVIDDIANWILATKPSATN